MLMSRRLESFKCGYRESAFGVKNGGVEGYFLRVEPTNQRVSLVSLSPPSPHSKNRAGKDAVQCSRFLLPGRATLGIAYYNCCVSRIAWPCICNLHKEKHGQLTTTRCLFVASSHICRAEKHKSPPTRNLKTFN